MTMREIITERRSGHYSFFVYHFTQIEYITHTVFHAECDHKARELTLNVIGIKSELDFFFCRRKWIYERRLRIISRIFFLVFFIFWFGLFLCSSVEPASLSRCFLSQYPSQNNSNCHASHSRSLELIIFGRSSTLCSSSRRRRCRCINRKIFQFQFVERCVRAWANQPKQIENNTHSQLTL